MAGRIGERIEKHIAVFKAIRGKLEEPATESVNGERPHQRAAGRKAFSRRRLLKYLPEQSTKVAEAPWARCGGDPTEWNGFFDGGGGLRHSG
jgi:hypothetical protein